MDSIPENVINKTLYKKAKNEADKIYARPGLYKSAFIVKKYKELGGKYSTEQKPETTGIRRWLKKEKWIAVLPYLESGKEVVCGSQDNKNIACRPLIRATEDTPITLPELLKIHSKTKLISLAKEKEKNPNKRINWKEGTIS
jgi:hypothetical protein